jgi:hypothetical protein
MGVVPPPGPDDRWETKTGLIRFFFLPLTNMVSGWDVPADGIADGWRLG